MIPKYPILIQNPGREKMELPRFIGFWCIPGHKKEEGRFPCGGRNTINERNLKLGDLVRSQRPCIDGDFMSG